MSARLLAILLCTGWMLGAAQGARAQAEAEAAPTEAPLDTTDEARDKASAHFRRGVELFQEAAYRAALIEFERAYETLPDFRLHYNIAQTKRLLHDYVGALDTYERYLAEGSQALPEERKQEVAEQMAQLEERIAHVTITASEASARIFIDERSVGVTPISEPIAVNVGRHIIEARNTAGLTTTRVIEVAGGDELSVHLPIDAAAPEPEATVEPIGEAPVSAPVATKRLTAPQRYAISAIAIGGAAILGGVGAGIVAAIEQNNFDDTKAEGKLGAALKHSKRAERSALATDILISTGLAFSVSGIITWFVKKPAQDSAALPRNQARVRLDWAVGPGNLRLQGAF